jgi:ABC-type Na+ efflux pump permease subunit
LIFALLVIGNSAFMAKFSFQEQFQMLKDISLGAMSVFSSLIAILATANFLPKDMEDRTIYTLLAKPVPRHRYLLGKLCGIAALLAASVLLMSALFLAVLWLRESAVLAETRAQMAGASPEEIAAAVKEVTDSTFNANLAPGIAIIFVKAVLLASLTLFISTFATSSIFTILMAAALYFIGHLQATAREYWLSGLQVEWWSRLLAAGVALLFPDLQAFNLTDDIIAGTAVPLALFLNTAALGALYTAVYFALAALVFQGREL